MRLTEGLFAQDRDFTLRFGDEVRSVEYGSLIDPSLLAALDT
jgi:hypothetical protein